jgi:hypothetical protein
MERATVLGRAEAIRMPAIPMSQIVYGEIVYWITITAAVITIVGPALALIFSENNVLHPIGTFSAIFAGMSPAEIWATSRDGAFPGGHFYFSNLTKGDGFTQFGIAIGCAVALPGLLGATVAFIRSKSYGFVFLSLWVAFMVFFSAYGLISIH